MGGIKRITQTILANLFASGQEGAKVKMGNTRWLPLRIAEGEQVRKMCVCVCPKRFSVSVLIEVPRMRVTFRNKFHPFRSSTKFKYKTK